MQKIIFDISVRGRDGSVETEQKKGYLAHYRDISLTLRNGGRGLWVVGELSTGMAVYCPAREGFGNREKTLAKAVEIIESVGYEKVLEKIQEGLRYIEAKKQQVKR